MPNVQQIEVSICQNDTKPTGSQFVTKLFELIEIDNLPHCRPRLSRSRNRRPAWQNPSMPALCSREYR